MDQEQQAKENKVNDRLAALEDAYRYQHAAMKEQHAKREAWAKRHDSDHESQNKAIAFIVQAAHADLNRRDPRRERLAYYAAHAPGDYGVQARFDFAEAMLAEEERRCAKEKL